MLYRYTLRKILWFLVIATLLVFGGLSLYRFQKPNDPLSIPSVTDQVGIIDGQERKCDIRQYGAQVGPDFKSTQSINAAINDCSENGGGTVIVPEGEWFSGGIKLKSNINLFLEEGSKIIFSTNLQDYLPVVFTRFQGIEFYNFSPLIYAENSQNISITGKGKLVGNGDAREHWTGGGDFEIARKKLYALSLRNAPLEERIFGDQEAGLRPSFIQFVNTKDILLEGITVENGPIWTIHPVYSENFTVRNLTINTWSGNTDGIVIDSTKNVLIENSYFSTGDDAVSIKSGLDEEGRRRAIPSENILIRNITVVKGSSGVSVGSEMSGGVRNVEVRDSFFKNTRHGFRIKSTRSRGGVMENIRVENIDMENITGDVLDINMSYTTELQSNVSQKPLLQNVIIKNIRGKDAQRLVINIDGISNPRMEDITFEDIFFTNSERGVSMKNAKNVLLKNIRIETVDTPTYEIEESQNITVQDSFCQKDREPCFLIGGVKTRNIHLLNTDFSNVSKKIEKVDGARADSVKIENLSQYVP